MLLLDIPFSQNPGQREGARTLQAPDAWAGSLFSLFPVLSFHHPRKGLCGSSVSGFHPPPQMLPLDFPGCTLPDCTTRARAQQSTALVVRHGEGAGTSCRWSLREHQLVTVPDRPALTQRLQLSQLFTGAPVALQHVLGCCKGEGLHSCLFLQLGTRLCCTGFIQPCQLDLLP